MIPYHLCDQENAKADQSNTGHLIEPSDDVLVEEAFDAEGSEGFADIG